MPAAALEFDDVTDSLSELVEIVTQGLDRTHRLVSDLRDFYVRLQRMKRSAGQRGQSVPTRPSGSATTTRPGRRTHPDR